MHGYELGTGTAIASTTVGSFINPCYMSKFQDNLRIHVRRATFGPVEAHP